MADPQRDECGFDVLGGRQGGDQVEGLEDEPDLLGADPGELGFAERAEVGAVQFDGALGRAVEAAEQVEQGGFAVAGAALDGQPLAVFDHQVQVADCRDGAAALLVELGHTGQLVHGCSPVREGLAGLVRQPGRGRPRAAAWRSASFRTSRPAARRPRPGPRPARSRPR